MGGYDYFYQMGRPPLRVDIMMSILGVEFEEAWENREVVELDDLKVPFISRSDLIRAVEVPDPGWLISISIFAHAIRTREIDFI